MSKDIDWTSVENAVHRYTTMVFRIAYNNVKNIGEAEDIVQDVFFKLMYAKNFENDDHIKAWLIRVTINICKNRLLLFRNTKAAPLNENIPYISDQQHGVFDELWKLPDNYRNVLYLYYYEGYTIPEIAALLKKSTGTISTWLSRARKKFKPILIKGGFENEC